MSSTISAATGLSKPGRILIVDDDQSFRKALAEILNVHGHTVLTAADGAAGMKAYLNSEPDLVLLDIKLPDEDGLELCRRMRARLDLSHIPIIIVTGYAEPQTHIHCFECGANDFLTKPPEHAVLLARVNSLLKFGSAVEALRRSNRELKETNDRLLELKRKREEVTRFIVHDLKNPLTVIQGNIKLLLMTTKSLLTEKKCRPLIAADLACKKLLNWINNLNELDRLENLSVAITAKPVMAEKLAEEAVLQVKGYAALQKKRLVFHHRENKHMVKVDRKVVINALTAILIRVLDDSEVGVGVELKTISEDETIAYCIDCPTPASTFGTLAGEGEPVKLDTPVKGDKGMVLTFAKLVSEVHGGEMEIRNVPADSERCQIVLLFPVGTKP